jgi:hypothetical protein
MAFQTSEQAQYSLNINLATKYKIRCNKSQQFITDDNETIAVCRTCQTTYQWSLTTYLNSGTQHIGG